MFPRFARHHISLFGALGHIRSSLTTESIKNNYCNSLLADTSVSNLAYFQLVQNTLTRVVTQSLVTVPVSHHASPACLHCLSVCLRINFKIAITAFEVMCKILCHPAHMYQNFICYSLDGQPIFAPPRSPWSKNRSPNLPISFPGIVGVYVPSLGELVIVVWPPIHNSHTHTNIQTHNCSLIG